MEMPLHPYTVGSFPESSGGGAEGDGSSAAAPTPTPWPQEGSWDDHILSQWRPPFPVRASL